MKKIKITVVPILVLFLTMFSCKKLIEIDGPKTNISSKNVYNDDATAVGTVTSLYVNLGSGSYLTTPGQFNTLSCIAGLSGDELIYYTGANNPILFSYYTNVLTNSNSGGSSDYWTVAYQNMYTINAAIEGLTNSNVLSAPIKKQLLGEAKFMRAFYYFYLVNLFGSVPLVLTSDYTDNSLITKSPKETIYQQIIKDLKDAEVLLSDRYLKGDGSTPYSSDAEERVRPTKWAAKAMLARTYLYIGDWSNAEILSSEILENSSQYRLMPLEAVFGKGSKEAIWQLQSTRYGINTPDANTFVLPSTGPSALNPVYLRDNLVNNFEDHDQRKIHWIKDVYVNARNYYYANKYKVVYSSDNNLSVIEYNVVLRLSEQILIRAEARARLNNISGAIADVDEIRGRAGLDHIGDTNPGISSGDLISVILNEKRLELFTEWGHRWLDLKRTGTIDEVMGTLLPKKDNNYIWKSYQQYYPINLGELKANPNLTQVDGY